MVFHNVPVLLWKKSPQRRRGLCGSQRYRAGRCDPEAPTVWYGAVLRGDDGTLTLGENSNVQDNAVLHCDVGGAVTLGKNVTVGHSAVVHGCTVGDGTLIGMHATLLNHCVVGKNCIIGAGALVPEGMVIPDGSVAVGVPARVIKPVTEAQIEANLRNAEHYVEHGKVHARELKITAD